MKPQFVSLTPKGIALGTLLSQGTSWEEAERIVDDGSWTDDGQPKPVLIKEPQTAGQARA